ncbi:hypothetical protein EW026_g2629 [Hermanssonia centrifuga]|uniref:Salicylate hydroxylase n=1 Tax=Hermanssonia centrifuga TaxID=98765 RepID=A0A4S4KMR3_9APHY|nr:hypothetical protein EW026_g2629 [Hermanssonia centrifuga]
MPNRKIKVAICGGGVGGLTLAVALSHSPNVEVDVYEAAQEFAEVGAGIEVAFHLRKGDEPRGLTFQKLITPGGLISFHRPQFQAVLLRHLSSSCNTYTSKRLVSYTQDTPDTLSANASISPIRLYFRDGTTATCDLLIGADGVKSTVRATMLNHKAADLRAMGKVAEADEALAAVQPKWSGTMAYRAVIPADMLRSKHPRHRVLTTPHIYLGQNSEMTVYPISRGTLINFAAFRSRYDLENSTLDGAWVQDVRREELLQDFDRWEPEVQALLDAHAMMPYQGAGAGQAIEDAFLLATLLSHPDTSLHALSRVCSVYDTVRRPFAQRVAEMSRENGILYTLNYPGLTFEEGRNKEGDLEKLREVYSRIRMNWEWAWETSVDGDVQGAIAMLEGRS